MKNCRPIYIVNVENWYEPHNSICCLETRSINKALNFIETIDRKSTYVSFYRHHPFKKFDVDEIMEVVHA